LLQKWKNRLKQSEYPRMRFLSIACSICFHLLIFFLIVYTPLYTPSLNLSQRHVYEIQFVKFPTKKSKKPKISLKKKSKLVKPRPAAPPAFVKNTIPPRAKPIEIPAKSIVKKRRVKKRVPRLPTPVQEKKSVLSRALREVSREAQQEEMQKRIVEEEIKRLEKQTTTPPKVESPPENYNMDIYLKMAEQEIKENWRYPAIGGPPLRAKVKIVIDRDGNILSYKLVKGSGREDFDNSVIKSIVETKHLPPPPIKGKKAVIIISFDSESGS